MPPSRTRLCIRETPVETVEIRYWWLEYFVSTIVDHPAYGLSGMGDTEKKFLVVDGDPIIGHEEMANQGLFGEKVSI